MALSHNKVTDLGKPLFKKKPLWLVITVRLPNISWLKWITNIKQCLLFAYNTLLL